MIRDGVTKPLRSDYLRTIVADCEHLNINTVLAGHHLKFGEYINTSAYLG
jgi:hypothetical protein